MNNRKQYLSNKNMMETAFTDILSEDTPAKVNQNFRLLLRQLIKENAHDDDFKTLLSGIFAMYLWKTTELNVDKITSFLEKYDRRYSTERGHQE